MILQRMILLPMVIFCAITGAQQQEQPVEQADQSVLAMNITANKNAQTRIALCVIERNQLIDEVARIMADDLQANGQCVVDLNAMKQMPNNEKIKSLYKQGYTLALFLRTIPATADTIELALFDTKQAYKVLDKKSVNTGKSVRGWAHHMADLIWPTLTGHEGFFLSKIAYCKAKKNSFGHRITHICIADHDGSNEQVLVEVPTVTFAPRWNGDITRPLLFYSEHTNTNVRLMMVDLYKRRRIASNFDGINMLPSFSTDGKHMVYCASRGDGSCQLYYLQKDVFKKITHNTGTNISPSISDDGKTIYFCSDYQTGHPQIYKYSFAFDTVERITDSGYCASPSFCQKRSMLAYTKRVNGVMQVFVYDTIQKNHTQLTFDAGDKDECSWSACGNYVVYGVEINDKSRIAIFNTLTHNQRYITPALADCAYPAWSPAYSNYIEVRA